MKALVIFLFSLCSVLLLFVSTDLGPRTDSNRGQMAHVNTGRRTLSILTKFHGLVVIKLEVGGSVRLASVSSEKSSSGGSYQVSEQLLSWR